MMHVWTRTEWTPEVDAHLGKLIRGQRERILGEVRAGTAQVFWVEGPEYEGVVAIRFENDPAGLALRVIAVKGRNVAPWLADLREMAKVAGATDIIIHAEDDAHVRLYQRIGFAVESADMRIAV